MKILREYKEDICVACGSFMVLYCIYATVLNDTITSDHIGIYGGFNGFPFPAFTLNSILKRIAGGRFSCVITDFLWWLMGLFGVNYFENQIPMKILMLISLAFSTAIIVKIFKPLISTETHYASIFLMFLALISFINPYFVEVWIYVGIEWAAGIITCSIAAYLFSKEKYIWSGFVVLLTIGFYQSFVENFMMMTSTYIFLKYRKELNLSICGLYAKMFIVAGIPSVINIISQKAAVSLWNNLYGIGDNIEGIKTATLKSDIIERLYHTVLGHYYYISVRGFGYFPYGFLFFISIIVFLITAYILKKTYGRKSFYHYCLFFILINCFTVAIYIVTSYSLEARIVWNYFVAVAMMFVVLYALTTQFGSRCAYIFAATILTVFLLEDIYATNTKVTDMFIAKTADELLIDNVEAEIEYYEKNTGIEITEVAARKSDKFDYQSKYLNRRSATSAFDRKLMANGWADVEALNFYTGKHYNEFYMTDEEYFGYFGDKAWDTFLASEQMVFEGNKLYWAIY